MENSLNQEKARVKGIGREAGVAVAISALRSASSCGIGDYLDLISLIDWCHACGLRIIQMLPNNDSGSHFEPYNAISAFALNPMYIALHHFDEVGLTVPIEIQQEIYAIRSIVESRQRFSFEEIVVTKQKILHKIFEANHSLLNSLPSFQQFCEHNQSWLESYAVFVFLSEEYLCHWTQWPDHSTYNSADVNQVIIENKVEIQFIEFLQWLADCQFKLAKHYAQSKNIFFKGDIPIMVNTNSADVWACPQLFRTDVVGGAPGDMFAKNGQNWGLAVFDWDHHFDAVLVFWKQRLAHAEHYYDLFRVDHVLAFFRLWVIPNQEVTALLGYFDVQPFVTLEELHNLDIDRLIYAGADEGLMQWLWGNELDNAKTTYFDYSNGRYILKPHLQNGKSIIDFFGISIMDFYQYNEEQLGTALIEAEAHHESDIANRIRRIQVIYKLLLVLYNRVFIAVDANHFAFTDHFDTKNTYQTLAEDIKHQLSSLFKTKEALFESMWLNRAKKLLTLIGESTHMVICAEDLGVVPNCVRPLLKQLGIYSFKVIFWEQNYHEASQLCQEPHYFALDQYEPLSLMTTSVHDSDTFLGWWETQSSDRQKLFTAIGFDGDAPAQLTSEWYNNILERLLSVSSQLVTLPIVDLLALYPHYILSNTWDNRINIPGTLTAFNWTWRMKINIETLQANLKLVQQINAMVMSTGRACVQH